MEHLLHYVWKHKLFPLKVLQTTNGLPVEVIDPGLQNPNAGPDFFNAKLKIDGALWVGNIEIHTHSSDWFRHGHHSDKTYDSVILHVVSEADTEITRSNGEQIPQLLLTCPDNVQLHYHELCVADQYPACHPILASLPKLTIHSWLTALQTERLEQKAQLITQRLKHRSLSGLALPAPHMVFVRSDFAVKQHLGIIGNIGTLRIFGSQQRLPTLQRKISFTDLRTAIARIGARQLVHLLIAGIAGMTLDPYEFHRSGALGDFGIDRANQIRVLYRLLLRVLPAVLLPAVNPRGGTVDRILRIGFDHQRFGAGVRAQRLQHCAQLANLIGAVRSSAGIAVALRVMPRLAACGKLMIGQTPTHRTIRIA